MRARREVGKAMASRDGDGMPEGRAPWMAPDHCQSCWGNGCRAYCSCDGRCPIGSQNPFQEELRRVDNTWDEQYWDELMMSNGEDDEWEKLHPQEECPLQKWIDAREKREEETEHEFERMVAEDQDYLQEVVEGAEGVLYDRGHQDFLQEQRKMEKDRIDQHDKDMHNRQDMVRAERARGGVPYVKGRRRWKRSEQEGEFGETIEYDEDEDREEDGPGEEDDEDKEDIEGMEEILEREKDDEMDANTEEMWKHM